MRRRPLLARAGFVATFGLAGCLSRFTGGGRREFRPAVESFNRGVDAFTRAQSTRQTARERYGDERWDAAATGYAAARDGFDAAATEFRNARDATSGACPAVHDRAQRQYRRSLALVEACDHWATAATARVVGDDGAAPREAERARVWDGRAADYPTTTRLDPDGFSCRQ
jgi:hypothetical protein